MAFAAAIAAKHQGHNAGSGVKLGIDALNLDEAEDMLSTEVEDMFRTDGVCKPLRKPTTDIDQKGAAPSGQDLLKKTTRPAGKDPKPSDPQVKSTVKTSPAVYPAGETPTVQPTSVFQHLRKISAAFIGQSQQELKEADIRKTHLSVLVKILELKEKQKGMVDPQGPFMAKWDLVMMVLLLFTALVTPFEVSFLETNLDGMFVINRLVDVGFICDMLVNFRLAFDDEEGVKIYSRRRIAQKCKL
jgi:hypothetical protein